VEQTVLGAADFFISALNTRVWKLLLGIILIYIGTFFFFAAFWYLISA
jgi:hypothetical protein